MRPSVVRTSQRSLLTSQKPNTRATATGRETLHIQICSRTSARPQANIQARIAFALSDVNTSDKVAFNVAKDGARALGVLDGSDRAHERHLHKKRRTGRGSFAFAGAGSLG